MKYIAQLDLACTYEEAKDLQKATPNSKLISLANAHNGLPTMQLNSLTKGNLIKQIEAIYGKDEYEDYEYLITIKQYNKRKPK